MKAPLRHVVRSPFLRILACLAWLLLAAVPVHGESMALPATHAMAAGMSMVATPTNSLAAGSVHVTLRAGDCCGGDGDHGDMPSCHCAATFSTALTAVDALLLLPVMPDSAADGTRKAAAPDMAHPPPLRPPAA